MKNAMITGLMLLGNYFLFAQEINGNLRFKSNQSAAKYATVDVFKEGKMVSTILTDSEGNFNLKLDTGSYRLVFNYADCAPITKNYRLTNKNINDQLLINDDKRDQKLQAKKMALSKSEKKSHSGSERGVYSYSIESEGTSIGGVVEAILDIPGTESAKDESHSDKIYTADDLRDHAKKAVSAGTLTGGEVNDFSKLKMWLDLTETEMKAYRSVWNIEPQQRFAIMLKSPQGIPLADASISLIGSHGKTVYKARTDNSGKAELWSALGINPVDKAINYRFEINYQGQKLRIDEALPFTKGINIIEMDASCEASKNVDIAFVVDATGSMSDEINYLKEELNEVIYQSKKINRELNYRYASIFYRDRGDDYLVHQLPFTRLVSESSDFIDMHSAAGGGDYEEAVDIALDSAINKLAWSKEARTRILFLVLDAPPHTSSQTNAKLENLTRTASMKGIHIIPIAASGINKSTEYLMRCMALATNGTYLFLSDHSGVGNTHLKPSTDDYKVEKVNEMLKRVLTAYTYMPDCQQRIPDLELPYSDSIITINPNHSNVEEQLSWKYYPNPTKGIVNLDANFDIDELYITDLSGKVLQVIHHIQQGQTQRIDLSMYASGIYLIKYPAGKRMYTGKIILVRED